MKRSLLDIASVGILGCTVALTIVVVRRELGERDVSESPMRMVSVTPQQAQVGRILGDELAPVTMTVFGDFQCPYCAKAQPRIDSVLRKYSGKVKVIYRHLPLETLHPHAWKAALASECAGEQGRFTQYHNLLYQVQDSIGVVDWSDLATRAGIAQLKRFQDCVQQEATTNAVERDVIFARSLHLRGTPAFVIGNELAEGLAPLTWMERRIEQELRRRQNVTSGRPGSQRAGK
jgi:protein-disulfide isomerase